jgi:hypothetical protein
VQETYLRIKKMFAWHGMKTDVDSYVKQCAICQQVKHERVHPAGLLQQLPIPDGAWQDITREAWGTCPLAQWVF